MSLFSPPTPEDSRQFMANMQSESPHLGDQLRMTIKKATETVRHAAGTVLSLPAAATEKGLNFAANVIGFFSTALFHGGKIANKCRASIYKNLAGESAVPCPCATM